MKRFLHRTCLRNLFGLFGLNVPALSSSARERNSCFKRLLREGESIFLFVPSVFLPVCLKERGRLPHRDLRDLSSLLSLSPRLVSPSLAEGQENSKGLSGTLFSNDGRETCVSMFRTQSRGRENSGEERSIQGKKKRGEDSFQRVRNCILFGQDVF